MIEHLQQMNEQQTEQAMELSEQIRPLLAGKGAWVQGSALADLVSIWLAGMYALGATPAEQMETRVAIFSEWCGLVLRLLPASIAQLEADLPPEGSA